MAIPVSRERCLVGVDQRIQAAVSMPLDEHSVEHGQQAGVQAVSQIVPHLVDRRLQTGPQEWRGGQEGVEHVIVRRQDNQTAALGQLKGLLAMAAQLDLLKNVFSGHQLNQAEKPFGDDGVVVRDVVGFGVD